MTKVFRKPPTGDTAPGVRLTGGHPTAVEASWRDPDDLNPGRREARQVHGTRAYDAVAAIAHRPGSLVTSLHVRAADRYLTEYEIGVLGARPAAPDRVPGTRSQGVMFPSERQCEMLRRVTATQGAVGMAATRVLRHVVLGVPDPARRDVSSYAERHGIDRKVAMGLLVAALDRLVEVYGMEEGMEETA